eukprot:jgi/Botrbrau1/17416/Bobra.0054s0012.1
MYDLEKPNRHKSLFRDRVFTADDWQWQKSWKRHLPDGTFWWVFLGFWRWVVYFTLIAFIICCYHQWIVPLGAPDWPGANYASTWQVFNLTAFALSLLMVFKTNSSYARWWEARTTWGFVFNAVRNMARRAIADIGEDHSEALAMFVRWCAALPYLLKDHLTLRTSDQLKELLKPEEMEWVGSWSHKPHGGAAVLSRILRQVSMPEYAMVAVDEQILFYVNLVGACERINRTAIPQAYTRHTSRFLMLWLTFLPFTLWPIYGWASPLIMTVVSFLLIGTENIGIQIEEPFCNLPTAVYCKSLSANVLEMYDKRKVTNDFVAAVIALDKNSGKKTSDDAPPTNQPPRSPNAPEKNQGVAPIAMPPRQHPGQALQRSLDRV